MSDQYKVALFRAALSGVVLGAIAGVTAYQASNSGKVALLTGILTGLGVFASRGGVEGTVDTLNAKA